MRINIFLQCQRIQVKYLFPEQLQDVIGNKKKKKKKMLTVDARRSVSGGSSHLPWQAGALDCLRSLLNAILIAASVRSNYFTCAPL